MSVCELSLDPELFSVCELFCGFDESPSDDEPPDSKLSPLKMLLSPEAICEEELPEPPLPQEVKTSDKISISAKRSFEKRFR